MSHNPELPPDTIGQGTPLGVGVVGLREGQEPNIDNVESVVESRRVQGRIDPKLAKAALDFTNLAGSALEDRSPSQPTTGHEGYQDNKLGFYTCELPQGGTIFVLMAGSPYKDLRLSYSQVKEQGVNPDWLEQEVTAVSLGGITVPARKLDEQSEVIIPFQEEESIDDFDMLTLAVLDAEESGLIDDSLSTDLLDYLACLRMGMSVKPLQEVEFLKEENGKIIRCNGVQFTFNRNKKK